MAATLVYMYTTKQCNYNTIVTILYTNMMAIDDPGGVTSG